MPKSLKSGYQVAEDSLNDGLRAFDKKVGYSMDVNNLFDDLEANANPSMDNMSFMLKNVYGINKSNDGIRHTKLYIPGMVGGNGEAVPTSLKRFITESREEGVWLAKSNIPKMLGEADEFPNRMVIRTTEQLEDSRAGLENFDIGRIQTMNHDPRFNVGFYFDKTSNRYRLTLKDKSIHKSESLIWGSDLFYVKSIDGVPTGFSSSKSGGMYLSVKESGSITIDGLDYSGSQIWSMWLTGDSRLANIDIALTSDVLGGHVPLGKTLFSGVSRNNPVVTARQLKQSGTMGDNFDVMASQLNTYNLQSFLEHRGRRGFAHIEDGRVKFVPDVVEGTLERYDAYFALKYANEPEKYQIFNEKFAKKTSLEAWDESVISVEDGVVYKFSDAIGEIAGKSGVTYRSLSEYMAYNALYPTSAIETTIELEYNILHGRFIDNKLANEIPLGTLTPSETNSLVFSSRSDSIGLFDPKFKNNGGSIKERSDGTFYRQIDGYSGRQGLTLEYYIPKSQEVVIEETLEAIYRLNGSPGLIRATLAPFYFMRYYENNIIITLMTRGRGFFSNLFG